MSKLENLRCGLGETEAFFVSSPANIRYLSGFTGEGYLIITKSEAFLVTDFRYLLDAGRFSSDFVVRNMADGIKAIMPEYVKKLYIEGEHMTYSDFTFYQGQLETVALADDERRITKMRAVKTADEIRAIAAAADIACTVFEDVLDYIKPGISERDIALELEYRMKKNGAGGLSFDTIVASGENSAYPHAVVSDKKLQNGDFVTLDFGCVYEGYCSDMTRTVAVGQVSERQRGIYDLVLCAQLAALEAVKTGAICSQVDAVARDIISGAGYGKNFGHSLGHSVGLQIHESPSLSPKCHDVLQEGMVVTVEPGVYVEGFGGVRIEDLVVVTGGGPQILTKTKKDLLIL